jgi:hypothetical protein
MDASDACSSKSSLRMSMVAASEQSDPAPTERQSMLSALSLQIDIYGYDTRFGHEITLVYSRTHTSEPPVGMRSKRRRL